MTALDSDPGLLAEDAMTSRGTGGHCPLCHGPLYPGQRVAAFASSNPIHAALHG